MIAWLALGFALVAIVFLAGTVGLVWRFWRQVQPQVQGLAAMLGIIPPADRDDDAGA